MNRFFLKTAVIASTLGLYTMASAQLANQNWLGLVPSTEKKAVNVFVEVENERPVVLSLSDSNDVEVWGRTYNKSTVAKTMLLEALPNGDYYLEASKADDLLKYQVVVRDHGVDIDYATVQRITKPAVMVKGNQIVVDYSSARGAESVYTRISEGNGRVLFERLISNAERRKIRYDLASVRIGDYVIEFRVGDKWFAENVTITHDEELAMQ